MVMTPRKNGTDKRARKEKAFARDEPAWRRADSSEKQGPRDGSHENDDAQASRYHRFDIVTRLLE
jgi:hypothetical protein